MKPANPLPNVLSLIPYEAVFLDPKLLSSIQEVMNKVTGMQCSLKFVDQTLDALAEAGYIYIHNVNKVIKTIVRRI